MSYAKSEARKAYEKEYHQSDKFKAYQRAYAAANRDKKSGYAKAWRDKNKEKLVVKRKEDYQKNREQILKNPVNKLYWYKNSAKNREIDFSLSTEEFNLILASDCHYCGKKEAMGVDRMDNDKGYFSYNVVACCKDCNFMKGTHSYQDFIQHIKRISDNFT